VPKINQDGVKISSGWDKDGLTGLRSSNPCTVDTLWILPCAIADQQEVPQQRGSIHLASLTRSGPA